MLIEDIGRHSEGEMEGCGGREGNPFSDSLVAVWNREGEGAEFVCPNGLIAEEPDDAARPIS